MIQYNQSWFENMCIDHQNTVIHELWQKEFRMKPLTFEYLLNLIAQNRKRLKIQKNNGSSIEIINRKFLSHYLLLELNSGLFFWSTFTFRNFLAVETYFFTNRGFHITRKLWRRTGLNVSINLYTHIHCPFFVVAYHVVHHHDDDKYF